ncbi:SDR family NAD(P)-dependent oxidoreductase [Paralimibaculum aggregatum]|uniref:SDR family NAD(P)-dependent oxidoreductase n=1 Tax=Paralimibaculum aggregatum TaxID=3036245 RepID=UPI002557800D|nr:SDR family oxidoreductase [Limibaculum sp. NKW23]
MTGASRGIGRAIAERALAEGYRVVGLSRAAVADAGWLHEEVDLAAPDARARLAGIAARHAPCRLVANAGIVRAGAVEAIADADFDASMRINLQAVIWSVQAVLPAMRAAGFGRIVTLGSRAALGKPGRAVYAGSKAAVTGLTRSLALELAPDGVTVNCVAPGPIETEMYAENQPEGSPARAAAIARVPLARMGRPAEVAHAAMHFLSDDAGYTTGQVLHVCGGLSVGGMGA